jgi:GNAT superfamily N-acetyltransferase
MIADADLTVGLTVEECPNPADLDYLNDRLNAFNCDATGYHDGRWLVILARDPRQPPHAAEGIVAGLHGFTWGGVCEVKTLWVREDARGRGLGRRLLAAAEAEAHARGCRQLVLSTHSFQAPDFYRRLGYAIVGMVEDYPTGHRSYWLVKALTPEAPARH